MSGYLDVSDLSEEQFAELKENYYYDILTSDDDIFEEVTCPEDIPDNIILEHYRHVVFTVDDFFCTAGQY